ncbi:hypothetical protein [Synechococcus sp. MIT S9452]|uniref:hypothetical protein n=1 Tax=Synechococcus sp. MIT S9452 TaxID=3082546 RepID=UPI0039A4E2EC
MPLQAHQVDDGHHQACLEARDYSGCIELNQAAAQQHSVRASEQKKHCTALNRTLLKEVRNAISVTALSYEAELKAACPRRDLACSKRFQQGNSYALYLKTAPKNSHHFNVMSLRQELEQAGCQP